MWRCVFPSIPAAEFVPAGKSGLCSSCLPVGRHSSSMAGYESAFQAIDETIADCCLRELPWEFSANIWRVDPNTNARWVNSFHSLCCLFVIFSPFLASFQLAKHFPFQNSLFPQNLFSTGCHQQKECTVSSLAGIGCQNPQKKDRPPFAKSSSVLCRMPRKSAD